MCLGSPLEGQHRGLSKTPESTIGEGGLPPHSQVSWCDSRESRGGVACVGASPWGLLHLREPVWRPGFNGKARVSQEWPWVSQWGGASVGASPRVSRGGEASDGASPYESTGQVRGVPG